MTVKYTDYTPDSVVQTIIENFVKRAEMGEKKYGVTLDREDLTIEEFIEHALQEHMDAILYLQKVKMMLEKQKNG
jgi:ATP-dependent Clp protease adapter protein ClpS